MDVSIKDMLWHQLETGTISPPMQLLAETLSVMDVRENQNRVVNDMIAGACLEREPEAGLAENALMDVFRIIDADASPQNQSKAAKAAGNALQELLDLPEPVCDAALNAFDDGGWKFAGLGIRSMLLCEDGESRAELLRIEPGRGVPEHGHKGREYTLVLTGAFHDGHGRFGPGDLCIADGTLEHRPVAEDHEICYALAVRDGAPAFKGALGLIQKALRLN